MKNYKNKITTTWPIVMLLLFTAAPLSMVGQNANLGIGTDFPSTELQINVNNNGFNIPMLIRNENGSQGGNGVGIGFVSESAGNWIKAGIFHERTGGWGIGKLHFLTTTSNSATSITLTDSRMTIEPGGDVGIGTTSPNATLEVDGTTRITDLAGIGNKLVIADLEGDLSTVADGNADQILQTDGSGNLSWVDGSSIGDHDWYDQANPNNAPDAITDNIYTQGNVGIGTTTPDDKLDIEGHIRLNNNMLKLRGGTDNNHYIQYTSTVDGPRIAGWTGIEFYKTNGSMQLGKWTSSSLDANTLINAIDGINTDRTYYFDKVYSTGTNNTANLGNWDFCALAGVAGRSRDGGSNITDYDWQCNVYSQDIHTDFNRHDNLSGSSSKAYAHNATSPRWWMYTECNNQCHHTNCTAICLNFE